MDDSYGLVQLHERLLLIMDDIDRVCRAHGLRYTLTGGSLLGAVRHKGFIPWDDDMDLRMNRDDFEKFKKVYESEKNKSFIIGHPCNLATYSIIDPTYSIPGVVKKSGAFDNPFISIFPMDNAPKNRYLARLKAHVLRILSGMLGRPPQYPYFPEKSRKMWDVTIFMGKIVGTENVERLFNRLCLSDNGKDTKTLASYTGNGKGIYVCYPEHVYASYIDMPFEDRIYMGLEEYDDYLTRFFGKDYMTPVPEDQRGFKHYTK